MDKLCMNFALFGLSHWVLMVVAVAIAVILIFSFKNCVEESLKKKVYWGLVSFMILLIVCDCCGRMLGGGKIFDCLPMEPVHVFVYAALYIQIKDSYSWIKFGYFITIPCVVVGLFVVPKFYTMYGMWSLSLISYFICLGCLAAFGILKALELDDCMSKKDVFNSLINYIIIVAFVHILNVLFRFSTIAVHSNYMGTMGEDYDVLNEFIYRLIEIPFVHQLPMFAVLVLLAFLIKIPFDVFKSNKDKQSHLEELVALGNLKAQQEYRKSGTGSQILIRSAEKAKPDVAKSVSNKTSSGFVSTTKEVQVNRETDK